MSKSERVNLQPGYLLHQYPYRDTSRLVELYVRDFGRVGVVARGARRPASAWRALLQPFQPLLVSWSGRGDLMTLTNVEAAAGYTPLAGTALLSGFYLNELLLKLTPRRDPHPDIFDCYRIALDGLHRNGSVAQALRIFEKRLLTGLGYGLNLDHEAGSSEPLRPDAWYRYDPQSGPVAATGPQAGGMCFSGASLLALAREDLASPASLRDAKQLLQAALDIHLGGRGLKSREVLRTLYKP